MLRVCAVNFFIKIQAVILVNLQKSQKGDHSYKKVRTCLPDFTSYNTKHRQQKRCCRNYQFSRKEEENGSSKSCGMEQQGSIR